MTPKKAVALEVVVRITEAEYLRNIYDNYKGQYSVLCAAQNEMLRLQGIMNDLRTYRDLGFRVLYWKSESSELHYSVVEKDQVGLVR